MKFINFINATVLQMMDPLYYVNGQEMFWSESVLPFSLSAIEQLTALDQMLVNWP